MRGTLRKLVCSGLTLAALAVTGMSLYSFAFYGPKWAVRRVPIHLQLTGVNQILSDGSASFNAVAQTALEDWNRKLKRLRFAPVLGSTAAIGDENGVNNVFFSNTVFGFEFGNALAVTLTTSNGDASTAEKDVVFNSEIQWDSYRGPLREGAFDTIYDLRRVALHEFGHVLGLDHPDEWGQRVSAIMNSIVSDIDLLRSDDIYGGIVLYGAAETKPIVATSTVKLLSPAKTPVVVKGRTVKITGRADPKTIGKIQIQNTDRFRRRTLATGVAKWSAVVQLSPGTNRLVVFAQPTGSFRFKKVASLTVLRN